MLLYNNTINYKKTGVYMFCLGGTLFTLSIIKKKPINVTQLSGCACYNFGSICFIKSISD